LRAIALLLVFPACGAAPLRNRDARRHEARSWEREGHPVFLEKPANSIDPRIFPFSLYILHNPALFSRQQQV